MLYIYNCNTVLLTHIFKITQRINSQVSNYTYTDKNQLFKNDNNIVYVCVCYI